MELKNNDKLQILTAKTLDLHRRLNEEMNQHGFSFCSHCSNHGRYCVVSDQDERVKMMDVRDSLKELHNAAISLQKLRLRHEREMDGALGLVEERRNMVMERVKRCSKEERERVNGVLGEVVEFVGDVGSDEFYWSEKIEEKNGSGICSFLVGTVRFGLEFVVMFAAIYTGVKICKSRQQINVMNLRINTESDVHLDVLRGRG